MTREEIEELKGLAASMGLYDDRNPCKRAVILGKAIKTLEQEPCEDAISRQAVLDQTYLWSKDEFLRVTNPFDYLRKKINSLPPVTPQPKTGHWIDGSNVTTCSSCKGTSEFHTDYCQWCGAKMGSEDKG